MANGAWLAFEALCPNTKFAGEAFFYDGADVRDGIVSRPFRHVRAVIV